jgi:septum formation protein
VSQFLTQEPLILASGSKARQQLLEALGLRFDVILSHCDEEAIKRQSTHQTYQELALELAIAKALVVSEERPEHYVIAADQLCVLEGRIFDKPGNHQVAKQHLSQLSGRTHEQISACCLAKEGQIVWSAHDTALLTMRHLSERTIEAYLLCDKPYQSCGAYHYEGAARWLFERVTGHDSTIQGLPLTLLIQALMDLRVVTF